MQIDILEYFVLEHPEVSKGLKLIMLGSVRNDSDANIVKSLKEKIKELKLDSYVEIIENAPYPVLLNYLKTCCIGLHTMKDEHFGIGIVEYMASGLIPLAHKSGGPLLDIVTENSNGFLADSIETYSNALHTILTMDSSKSAEMRYNARNFVTRFSESAFSDEFLNIINTF
jgi:alpha-1,2-mannosyltransferase